MKQFDVAVLGGGFYGCCIAILLARQHSNVTLIEKEGGLLQKASSANQARVHGGYHYPRSFMTATRSLINYSRFLLDFHQAIIDDIEHIYAIARYGSKTNARQFYNNFKKMGAKIYQAPSTTIKKLFNLNLIEDAFIVNETVFDWTILEKIMLEKLSLYGVKLSLNTEIHSVTRLNHQLVVNTSSGNRFLANQVMSCLYSRLNTLQANSNLPLLPLKHELAELSLVKPLQMLEKRAITIMDGHFFSLMPFPQKNLSTLSHVRYTPHESWIDQKNFHINPVMVDIKNLNSNFIYMQRDAARYMPMLKELQYFDSIYEIKTILQSNEIDDGRPILFREEPTLPNFFTIMGSKIDNIYDILDVISNETTIKACFTKSEYPL
ncbi:MAG TPA: FAD-dependent oxidoreductase [Gammaproteobacteria bacterium]|nr:FAD-dependent oxidoreductase [Gammaproteobacteria bacterium]